MELRDWSCSSLAAALRLVTKPSDVQGLPGRRALSYSGPVHNDSSEFASCSQGIATPLPRSLSGLGRRSENWPQRGQFLSDSPLIAIAMGQEADEKWTAAVNLQPTLPKSDRLLDSAPIQKNAMVNSTSSSRSFRVVLSGSYHRRHDLLRRDHEALLECGFDVLSPSSIEFTTEKEGFLFTKQEEGRTPHDIELGHLDAIRRADFLWLHTPEGYVGPSGALEIGFAAAIGVPVFSRDTPSDVTVRGFVAQIGGPSEIPSLLRESQLAALSGVSEIFQPLRQMQRYYFAAAQRRGYDRESLKDAMILITEEIGELVQHPVNRFHNNEG